MPPRQGSTTATSSAQGRLRDVRIDPLESMGLPSKGETRLLDFDAQETYFTLIQSRCRAVQDYDASDLDTLESHVSALSLDTSRATATVPSAKEPTKHTSPSLYLPARIIMAMRKLREAIVASKRVDIFAQEVYKFIIRSTILAKNMEAYHPALLYLLRTLHSRLPLSLSDLTEFSGYLVLDMACRQNDLNAAYATRFKYKLEDRRIQNLLHALARNDWVSFWKNRRSATVRQAQLLSWSNDRLRQHISACLVRSYFTAEAAYVERAIGKSWREFSSENNFTWQTEGSNILLRRKQGAR